MWWSIAGILAVAVLIAVIEISSLRKRKSKKDLWAFSLLLLLGTGLSIAQGLQADIPNPLDWMAAIFQPLGNWMKSTLG
jgi:hypothetical protein